MPFANEVITIYNRCKTYGNDGRTEVSWRRRVLDGCRVMANDELKIKGGVNTRLTRYNVDIPDDTDYVTPAQWDELSDRSGKFTLASGDVVILCESGDDISNNMTLENLLDKYALSGAATVQSVQNNSVGPFGHYTVTVNWV